MNYKIISTTYKVYYLILLIFYLIFYKLILHILYKYNNKINNQIIKTFQTKNGHKSIRNDDSQSICI